MKQLKKILSLLCIFSALLFAENKGIAPCDEITLTTFGDMLTLSKNKSELRRYEKGVLINRFKDNALGSKINLEDPLKPVAEDPDKIHILDAGTRSVISWDRFLNLHSITPLHDDILSPSAFTVTSEHDWLIFDDFLERIVQIHSGEKYPQPWGDRQYSPPVELFAIEKHILIHEQDNMLLIIADESGNTLNSFLVPDSLSHARLFPIDLSRVAIHSDQGQFLWKPSVKSLRYLSNINNVIYIDRLPDLGFRLITRDGVINYLR